MEPTGTIPEDKTLNVVVEKDDDHWHWSLADGTFVSSAFADRKQADLDALAHGFVYREPGTYAAGYNWYRAKEMLKNKSAS